MSDLPENTGTEKPEEPEKLHLTWKRFRKIVFHLWRQFDDQYYAGFAAQIAYFFFMASVPKQNTSSTFHMLCVRLVI